MPLKHDTETLLVFVLGLAIALSGMVVAFLPPLSVTVVPWAIAFLVSIAYPLSLYPLFKRRRADYQFRLLHFSPALMLLVWVVVELLAAARPNLQYLQTWYTASWSFIAVVLAIILLILFCLSVIRQRFTRMALLLLILVPFVLLSRVSERKQWDQRLASTLWGVGQTGTGFIAAQSSSGNLQPSSDPAEEGWRVELRRMEQRRRELLLGTGSDTRQTVSGALEGTKIAAGGLASEESASSAPPRLPTSGFGMEVMAIIVAAAFCTTLHRRTMTRFSLYSVKAAAQSSGF